MAEVHMCPSCEFVYLPGKDDDLKTCPEPCGRARYRNPRKKRAFKTVFFFPLRRRLEAWFSHPVSAILLQFDPAKAPRADPLLADWTDGLQYKLFQESVADVNGFVDPRHLALLVASDGFEQSRSSWGRSHETWPIVAVPFNIQSAVRSKAASCWLWAIIPGPKRPASLFQFMGMVVRRSAPAHLWLSANLFMICPRV
jgi:hypothetical protein